MARYKIEVDEDTCIGCGACAATCPDSFEMKDTDAGQKAKAKKPDVEELGCAQEAAEVCPVNAIHIKDTKENKKII
jgi:ferredoxin